MSLKSNLSCETERMLFFFLCFCLFVFSLNAAPPCLRRSGVSCHLYVLINHLQTLFSTLQVEERRACLSNLISFTPYLGSAAFLSSPLFLSLFCHFLSLPLLLSSLPISLYLSQLPISSSHSSNAHRSLYTFPASQLLSLPNFLS